MYLLRPTPAFSVPPLCTLAELRTVYTLDDLADMHEILDLRQATIERAQKEADAARERQQRSRRR